MLKLNNIRKVYGKDNVVLNNLNISFNKGEFISILGESGSGKSTLLNIIGGLDLDYEGEIYLNGENISGKRDSFYDKYRNGKIGFVFQDYNLIETLNVYKNVEMSLLISKSLNKKEKILNSLEKVGLLDCKNKKVNELSGGQKQRVAIARAIVNDPDILLLDEATGALDSVNSISIMNLVKKLSNDKLVIMVTHNEKLAMDYSDRVVRIKDGFIENSDCDYHFECVDNRFGKVGFSFFNMFKLAFRNIKAKLFRNVLTILAFVISIIGVCFVIAISFGFDAQVDILKEETLSDYPIVIMNNDNSGFSGKDGIYSYKVGNSNINNNFISYLDNYNSLSVVNNYDYRLRVISKNKNGFKLSEDLPFINVSDDDKYLFNNYKVLSGRFPKSNKEILLKVNSDNMISEDIFNFFGVSSRNVSYDYFVGKEIKVVNNDEYYYFADGYYDINKIDKVLYEHSNNVTLKIVGVIKSNENTEFNTLINEEAGGIYIKNSLIEEIININTSSGIVKFQKKKNYNVINGEKLNDKDKRMFLNYLGDKQNPYLIYVYLNDYVSKDKFINYLDNYKYNDIKYVDVSLDIIGGVKTLVFGVASVLFVLSMVSLVVSLILIVIITYTSSLERKKEIGILRSLGARKKDIRRLFVFESIILSVIASLIAILIVKLSIIPLNDILYRLVNIDDLMIFSFDKILLVVAIGILTSLFGSVIPAIKASKKDPVCCLK